MQSGLWVVLGLATLLAGCARAPVPQAPAGAEAYWSQELSNTGRRAFLVMRVGPVTEGAPFETRVRFERRQPRDAGAREIAPPNRAVAGAVAAGFGPGLDPDVLRDHVEPVVAGTACRGGRLQRAASPAFVPDRFAGTWVLRHRCVTPAQP